MTLCSTCGQHMSVQLVVLQTLLCERELDVAVIRQRIKSRMKVTDKEIANALAYLVRKGRVKRPSYGRYMR